MNDVEKLIAAIFAASNQTWEEFGARYLEARKGLAALNAPSGAVRRDLPVDNVLPERELNEDA